MRPTAVRWITPELATAVHARLTAEHGGPAAVRDPAALAAALSAAVPAGRGRVDLFAVAAAYAAEVVARRPFEAANVRSAYALCRTFLSLNGVEVTAAPVDRVLAVRRLAAGQLTRDGFAAALANRSPNSPSAGATAGLAGTTAGRSPVRRTAMDFHCPRCGSTVAEPGSVHSTGRIYFRPTNAKFLTLKTGDIELKANACAQCGHVDFVADVGKLDTLTRRAEPV